jgi:hypothetical protein
MDDRCGMVEGESASLRIIESIADDEGIFIHKTRAATPLRLPV